MKHILKQLNQKPIAYYPAYRQMTGSTTAGILLSQLMYWFSKQDKIYKTNDELECETMLTKDELKLAKTKLKKLGFLTISLEGLPAKTYYEIDWDKYLEALQNLSSNSTNKLVGNTPTGQRETHQQCGGYPTNTSIYTENTTKITTEIKEKEKEKKSPDKKNEIIAYPQNLNLEAFEQWCNYKGKKYSAQGKKLSITKLAKYPYEVQMQMVEQSIVSGYQGLFEVKKSQAQKQELSVRDIMLGYSQDRNAGLAQEVAKALAIEKTSNYELQRQISAMIQSAEIEYSIQERRRAIQEHQNQIKTSEEKLW